MKSYSNDIPTAETVAAATSETENAAAKRHATITSFFTVVVALLTANIAVVSLVAAVVLGYFK
jgi:hypothetical protein